MRDRSREREFENGQYPGVIAGKVDEKRPWQPMVLRSDTAGTPRSKWMVPSLRRVHYLDLIADIEGRRRKRYDLSC